MKSFVIHCFYGFITLSIITLSNKSIQADELNKNNKTQKKKLNILNISKQPKRIISLGPIITDMIYLLGAQDNLAGITSYCVLPKNSKPKEIIGTVMHMNIEKIISLEPDLVFANNLTRQKQIDILKKQNINVKRLVTPTSYEEICKRFLDFGKLLGKTDKAKEIIAKTRKKVSAIRQKALTKEKRSIFIQIGLKPMKTSGKNSFINDYIEFAGGKNIALDMDSKTENRVLSKEIVLKKNPDVIVIATMGTSRKAAENEKKAWQRLKFLKASKNNEIHILNPDMVCSPTPQIFAKGLETFYNLIYKNNESSFISNPNLSHSIVSIKNGK